MDEDIGGEGSTPETTEAPDTGSTPEGQEAVETQGESTSPEGQVEGDEPAPWRNLLNKYQGDKAKAGEAYWRSVNDAARFSRENQELHERLQRAEQARQQPQQPPEVHPSVRELDNYIHAVQADIEEHLPAQANQLRQAWNEAHRNAIKLEALMERADELEKDQIQARLENVVLKRDMIYRDYKAVENDIRRAQNALRQAYGNKTNLEQQLDAERASQEQARETTARFNEEFPKEIDSYIERFSKDYNVPDAQKEYLWAVVNRDLMFDLYHLQGTPVQEINFEQMTRDKVEQHVKMLGLAKKQAFTNSSQQRIAARPPSSNGSPRPNRQTSASDVTDEMMNRPALARKAFVGR